MAPELDPHKECVRCNKLKPQSEFVRYSRAKSGYTSHCKDCSKISVSKSRRSLLGYISDMYCRQVARSKKRGHPPPNYSRGDFEIWLFENGYKSLHKDWADSGHETKLAPSCDRLDDSKGYALDNIRLVTWKENLDKSSEDQFSAKLRVRHRAIRQLTLDGEIFAEYDSISIAERVTGISRGSISNVANPNRNNATAKGFIWEYV